MKLEQFRQDKNMSRSEAARTLSVNESTYYRWEKGTVLPRRDALAKISRWSGGKVKPNDFL